MNTLDHLILFIASFLRQRSFGSSRNFSWRERLRDEPKGLETSSCSLTQMSTWVLRTDLWRPFTDIREVAKQRHVTEQPLTTELNDRMAKINTNAFISRLILYSNSNNYCQGCLNSRKHFSTSFRLIAYFQWLSSLSMTFLLRPAFSSAFAVRSILPADFGDTPPHRALTPWRMRFTWPTLVTPRS